MRRKSPPHLWNWENPIPLKTFQFAGTIQNSKTYVSSKKLRFTVGPSKSSFFTNINNYCCLGCSEDIYIYIWSRPRGPPPPPPNGMGPQVAPHFPSICKLLAAFLKSSLVFARFLQRFWLPASHLLGTCHPLDDLRSRHTPSKYLRAIYSYIYMCYVSTSYI